MREGTYPNPHTAGSKSQTLATQASSRNRAGRRVDRLGQIQSSIEASPEIAGLRFALVAPHFSFFSAGFASSRSRGHNRARRQTHRCPARVFLTQECSLDSRGRRSIDLQEIYSRGGQAPTRNRQDGTSSGTTPRIPPAAAVSAAATAAAAAAAAIPGSATAENNEHGHPGYRAPKRTVRGQHEHARYPWSNEHGHPWHRPAQRTVRAQRHAGHAGRHEHGHPCQRRYADRPSRTSARTRVLHGGGGVRPESRDRQYWRCRQCRGGWYPSGASHHTRTATIRGGPPRYDPREHAAWVRPAFGGAEAGVQPGMVVQGLLRQH